MKKVTLNKKEKKGLNDEIAEAFGIQEFFSKDDFVVLADDTYILNNGDFVFFYKEDLLLPTIYLLLQNNFLKKIIIDMGAVPFAAKGADMMRPGIVAVDTGVEENEIVSIVDENNLKPIAVGQSLFSKEEMEDMEAGKMVLNLHYVGDDVWKLFFSVDQ